MAIPKSSLEPTRVLDFVGNIFDTKRRRIENRKGMVTALLRSWLRLRMGLMRKKGFEIFSGGWSGLCVRREELPRFWRELTGGSCLVSKRFHLGW